MRQNVLKITIFGLLTTLFVSCSSDNSDSINAMEETISFRTVEFAISSNSDTTIFGQQGTRLFIEKETFQYPDGSPVKDSVIIKLKEFYKKSDIALADLSTISDGKLLETGGMVNITAFSRGRQIEIKKDKSIVIHFPKRSTEKTMNLFYTGNCLNDSSVVNWKVDTSNLLKQVAYIGMYGYESGDEFDSTQFEFRPKNYIDTGYYFSPLNTYINSFPFSSAALKAIDKKGISVDCILSKNGRLKNVQVDAEAKKEVASEIMNFINTLPDLEPSRNNKNEIVERTVTIFLQVHDLPVHGTKADYIKSFSNKYSKYENKPIRNVNDAELNYFIFSIAKLGWINCDRFVESEKTTDYIVLNPSTKDTKIKMIFTDIDGVLMAEEKEGRFIFYKVPIGKRVTIFAVKNAGGQFQTAFQEVTIADKPLETLVFKESTLADLRKQLEKLN